MSKKIKAAIKSGTIEEKIAKLEAHKKAIEEKIAECQEALEESKKPKMAIPFVPQEGEEYWVFTVTGQFLLFTNYEAVADMERIKTGLCYRTEAEARLADEKCCAETELLMLCDGLERKGSERIWFPVLQEYCLDGKPYSSTWKAVSDTYDKMTPYRFASHESCQAAIDKLGDRKLRLVFNIPVED